jgi:hypothetical protein
VGRREKQQDALGVTSATGALADSYEHYEQHLAEGQSTLKYVPEAYGLAVALGPQVITADLFDKPATCEKVWTRLLSGLVLDASAEGQMGGTPDPGQVEQLIHEARNAAWTQTDAVGEGQEFRAEFNGKIASVLLLDGTLVHGSIAGTKVGQQAGTKPALPRSRPR